MPSADRRLDGLVVALDVDGVLLDSERGGAGSWQVAVADRFGVDQSELDRTLFDRWWPDVIVGRTSIEEALESVIGEEAWPVSVDALLECWFEADFWPCSDVIAAANSWSARGARLALVTNQEHRRAAYVEARLGELLPFDRMVYSAAVGRMKSEPEFFMLATRLLTAPDGAHSDGAHSDDAHSDGAHSIVFMDDTMENVEVARRAGWTAVHFQPSSWSERMEDALGVAASAR
jgi:putative hydrolase of the HAD superfamily